MTRDDLIRTGWTEGQDEECVGVWEHADFPGVKFSFYAAVVVTREQCEEEDD